jgi:hypothetical protein
MKRTCNGCRALDGNSPRGLFCSLGYTIRAIRILGGVGWGQYRYQPQEECEKPKTVKRLEELKRK